MYLRGSVSSGLNIELADSYNNPSSNWGKVAPAVNMLLQVDAYDYRCLCCTRVHFITEGNNHHCCMRPVSLPHRKPALDLLSSQDLYF